MRLHILESGHRPLQKIPFMLMKLVAGHVPGPVLTLAYRRELFGRYFADCLQEGMRGSHYWSVGEVELFAAFVSKLNSCRY